MSESVKPSVSDWNTLFMIAFGDGVKDGASLAVSETITDVVVSALDGKVPYLSMINSTEFGRSVLLVVTPWAIGALTCHFPEMFPAPLDPEFVRRTCYRATRVSVAMRFSSTIARLRGPLTKAFKDIADMSIPEQ